MSVDNQRRLQALGDNLQQIMKRLLNNQNLARYLYYTDKDPLDPSKPDVKATDLYQKQVLIIPVIGTKDDSKSILSLRVLGGTPIRENTEFMELLFNIEVFVPNTQWILKSDSLRPFLIMSEIKKSLEGKTINGLGKISALSFDLNFLTEEMSCYEMTFSITAYE